MKRIVFVVLAGIALSASRPFTAAAEAPAVGGARPHKRHHHHKRPRANLALPANFNTDANLGVPFAVGQPRQVLPSYYQEHAALVQHSLIRFRAAPINVNPPLAGAFIAPTLAAFFFAPPVDTDDVIELGRQRDQMLEFRDAPAGASNLGAGIGAFAASLMASAHGPAGLRLLFDGPVHLGPAIFDSGGMGMGLSGSLPASPTIRNVPRDNLPRAGTDKNETP